MKKFLKNIIKLKKISTIKDFRLGHFRQFLVRVTLFYSSSPDAAAWMLRKTAICKPIVSKRRRINFYIRNIYRK